jgi:hypothetical protein
MWCASIVDWKCHPNANKNRLPVSNMPRPPWSRVIRTTFGLTMDIWRQNTKVQGSIVPNEVPINLLR